TLITGEEKQPVLHNRSTYSSAELIALYGVAPGSEWIPGIKNSVPHKLKQIAMEIVGAGFRHYADVAGGFHPALGTRSAGLDLEFLQRIRKWQRHVATALHIHMGGAI